MEINEIKILTYFIEKKYKFLNLKVTCTIYSEPNTLSSWHAIIGYTPVALTWVININNTPYLTPF